MSGGGLDSQYIDKFIESVPFFKEFSEHEKRKITGDKNNFKQYEKNLNIFKEGDEGHSLFVILFGTIDFIKLCDGADIQDGRVSVKGCGEKERVLCELESGSVFGVISMLTGRKRSVTTRVSSEKAVVMEITEKFVDSLIPSIQVKFHKQLLLALIQDLDDMDIRYLKLQDSINKGSSSS